MKILGLAERFGQLPQDIEQAEQSLIRHLWMEEQYLLAKARWEGRNGHEQG